MLILIWGRVGVVSDRGEACFDEEDLELWRWYLTEVL